MSPRLPAPSFNLGQTVYQRAAPEDDKGIVTGLLYRPGGAILYLVTWGVEKCPDETQHWECELTADRAFETTGTST